MRQVGHRTASPAALRPSAQALRDASVHQAAGAALAPQASTGVCKGIYRFATHEAMNRHADEALTLALVMNLQRRALRP